MLSLTTVLVVKQIGAHKGVDANRGAISL
jgi:hypothetical protein